MLWPHLELFWKPKGALELVFLDHFLHDFWRKMFILLYFINWPFHCLVAFPSWDIGQYVFCNWLLTRFLQSKSFKLTLDFKFVRHGDPLPSFRVVIMVQVAPFFVFIVLLENTFLSKDNGLFRFFAYILMNFYNFLKIITSYHKL